MHLIVGLGNPGKEFEHTRHNAGFDTVSLLAEKHNIRLNKSRCKALTGEGVIAGQKVLLALPQTYMNLSGEAVSPLMSFYKLPLTNLLVVYDDIDLPKAGCASGRAEARGPTTACAPSSISWGRTPSPGCAWASASRITPRWT